MREEALKKRRKAAEQLLQWHKKLLEEEKRIAILESTASAVISQKPSTLTSQEKLKFQGKELNQLWFNLTGTEDKKFTDDKVYLMSQLALERFCKNGCEYSIKTKTLLKKPSDDDISVSENIRVQSSEQYVSDFENETPVVTEDIDIVDKSIDILINNFNQIQDDISTLNITKSKKSQDSQAEDISDKLESEAEISVIETNKSVAPVAKLDESSSSNDKKTIDENLPDIDENVSEKSIKQLSKISRSEGSNCTISSEDMGAINSEIQHPSRASELPIVEVSDDKIAQKIDTDDHVEDINATRNDSPVILTVQSSSPVTAVEEYSAASRKIESTQEVINTDKFNDPITLQTKECLNKSQEILLILGEPEVKTSSDEEVRDVQLKESLTESEDILSKLSHIITDLKGSSGSEVDELCVKELSEDDAINGEIDEVSDKSETKLTGSSIETSNVVEDDMSRSLIQIYDIVKSSEKTSDDSSVDILEDVSALQVFIKNELEQTEKSVANEEILVETNIDDHESDIVETVEKLLKEVIDVEVDVTKAIVNRSEDKPETNEPNYLEDSDESKLTLSDKSNESFIINDINDESFHEHLEETSKKVVTDNSVTEDIEESNSKTSSAPVSNLSYGILEKPQSDSFEISDRLSKEDVCYEEKEHDSLSSMTGGSSSDLSEMLVSNKRSGTLKGDSATTKETKESSGYSDISEKAKSASEKENVSSTDVNTDVSRGDKSPTVQDLYVSAYDMISPVSSPEKVPSSPVEEHKLVTTIFYTEAEELLRKQLAVEEEIKAITEQQQKEQVPLLYIREIPNKPPPPYTPPSSLVQFRITPTVEEIEEIALYYAKILHKAYLSNNLANANTSSNTLSLISKSISKECYKFVFDLCKEFAMEHYRPFETDKSPSWLRVPKKIKFTAVEPLDSIGLKTYLIKKLKQTFGYQKSPLRENAVIKWNRKKQDYVDTILVMDCQQEEAQWTNYQKDELLVKDEITNDILDSLLADTSNVLANIFKRKQSLTS